MVDFSNLAAKAKGFVSEHSDKVKGGVAKGGEFVGNKIGHDKVDPVEDKIGEYIDQLKNDDQNPQADPPAAGPRV